MYNAKIPFRQKVVALFKMWFYWSFEDTGTSSVDYWLCVTTILSPFISSASLFLLLLYYFSFARIFSRPFLTPLLSTFSVSRQSSVHLPYLLSLLLAIFPCHGASSAITAPSIIWGRLLICVSLSLPPPPPMRRVSYLTIYSGILVHINPHILDYSCSSLNMKWEASLLCMSSSSVPVILYVDYTKGVNFCLCSRQGWRYLSFLSFSAFASTFSSVVLR